MWCNCRPRLRSPRCSLTSKRKPPQGGFFVTTKMSGDKILVIVLLTSFPRRRESSSDMRTRLPLGLRPSGLLLALPKSNQKARRRTRCSDSHPANQNPLRFSARRGRSDSASMYCFAIAAIHRRDPAGVFPPRLRCSAPRTAPLTCYTVRPWTASSRIELNQEPQTQNS